MQLIEACDIANACGLETLGEAVLNIEIHAMSLFAYSEIDKELEELESELKELGDAWENISIHTILGEETTDV